MNFMDGPHGAFRETLMRFGEARAEVRQLHRRLLWSHVLLLVSVVAAFAAGVVYGWERHARLPQTDPPAAVQPECGYGPPPMRVHIYVL